MMRLTLISFLFLSLFQLGGCTQIVSMSHDGPLVENEGKRTWGRAIDDGTIESKAKINMRNQNDDFKRGRIRVISHNGIVLLLGQVPYDSLVSEASGIVRQIRHVNTIENKLTVGPNTPYMQRAKDKLLAAKAKRAVIESNQFDARRLEVFSENNVIYLMGIVNRNEANTITNAIQTVPGVVRIVKVFEYLD